MYVCMNVCIWRENARVTYHGLTSSKTNPIPLGKIPQSHFAPPEILYYLYFSPSIHHANI